MGRTVNATIVFGISVYAEDRLTLPWFSEIPWCSEDREFTEDESEWWREVNGYKPIFNPWAVEDSPSQEELDRYYQEQREWDKNCPIPFEMLYFGGEEDNGFFITSPKYPRYEVSNGLFLLDFDPTRLKIEPDEAFDSFVTEYLPGSEMGWNLILWSP